MGIKDRIDAITGIDEAHLGASIPAPKSVKIELTGRCNFSCAFCARGQNLREVEDIDKDFFKRILKEMRDEGVEEIGLFYLGESFMVPWLPEAIQYAKDIGFPYVFLTTNGSLATPGKVEACMKAGLDSLKFSYNYSDGDQLKEIAKVKTGYFERIVNNMKQASRIRQDGGYKCGLYASYIEYDGDQQERMMEAVRDIEPYMDEVYALPLPTVEGVVRIARSELETLLSQTEPSYEYGEQAYRFRHLGMYLGQQGLRASRTRSPGNGEIQKQQVVAGLDASNKGIHHVGHKGH